MSDKQDNIYSDYIVKGKTRSKGGSSSRDRGIVFLVMLLSLGAVLIITFLFSDGLNLSHIGGAEIKLPQYKYYALMLYSSDDEAERTGAAQSISSAGGAGYIRESGVYAACYYNESDIDTVIVGINTELYTPVKKTVLIAEKTVSIRLGANALGKLTGKMKYSDALYRELYDLSLMVDTSQIAIADAKKAVAAHKVMTESDLAEFVSLTSGNSSMTFTRFKADLVSSINMLENLASCPDKEFASKIKYGCLDIVFRYSDFIKEI